MFAHIYDFKLKGRDVLSWSSYPLWPVFDPMSKTCHNFFSIGRILPKNVLVRKNIQFVYFPKYFVSLFVSHEISLHLAKNMLFYVKKVYFLLNVMKFRGKQTNQQNILENRQTYRNCVITRPPPSSNSFQKFQTGLVVWVWVGRFQGKTWWAVLPCKSRKPRENLRSEKKFQTGIPHLSLRGGSGNYTITVMFFLTKTFFGNIWPMEKKLWQVFDIGSRTCHREGRSSR